MNYECYLVVVAVVLLSLVLEASVSLSSSWFREVWQKENNLPCRADLVGSKGGVRMKSAIQASILEGIVPSWYLGPIDRPRSWVLGALKNDSRRLADCPSNSDVQSFFDEYATTGYDMDIINFIHRGCPMVSKNRLPKFLSNFDWFLWDADMAFTFHTDLGDKYKEFGETPSHVRSRDPKTVFASSSRVYDVVHAATRDFDSRHSDRILVLAGSEAPASFVFGESMDYRNKIPALLRRYFRKIYFQSLDIKIPGFDVFPYALNEAFFRHEGLTATARTAIAKARVDNASKPRRVLAAWGTLNPHLEEDLTSVWGQSRASARAWSSSQKAASMGVEMRSLGRSAFWGELKYYQFILCPIGGAIHTHKMAEALLVLTVPIVQRGPYPASDLLRQQGFPIVVVNDWDEITPSKLNKWWRRLSPKLERFRNNCLTTDGFWKFVTGTATACT